MKRVPGETTLTLCGQFADNRASEQKYRERHVEFSIKQSSPEKQRSACVVLGVFEGGQLTPAAHLFDQAADRQLSKLIASGDMTGKAGSTVMLHMLCGVSAERVLLVGLGKPDEFNAKQFLDMLRTTFATLQKTICKNAALYLDRPDC